MRRCLEALCGRTDAQLGARLGAEGDEVTAAVLKLAVLCAGMEAWELPRVRFQPAVGLCAGMLVCDRCFDAEGS